MIAFTELVFYGFSAIAIFAASMVVISKNAVRSVLWLVLTFFSMAAIWMLLESEFLAIVLVLVYVGAVMVLFLFVVMMLDIEITEKEAFTKHWPVGLIIACLMLGVLGWLVGGDYFGLESMPLPPPRALDYSAVKTLGAVLYTDFLLPFEMAGIILLIAMIAAIALTFRGPRHVKSQKAAMQVRASKKDRLTLVKMPAQRGEKT